MPFSNLLALVHKLLSYTIECIWVGIYMCIEWVNNPKIHFLRVMDCSFQVGGVGETHIFINCCYCLNQHQYTKICLLRKQTDNPTNSNLATVNLLNHRNCILTSSLGLFQTVPSWYCRIYCKYRGRIRVGLNVVIFAFFSLLKKQKQNFVICF